MPKHIHPTPSAASRRRSSSCAASQAHNAPTANDAARADVNTTNVIIAHSAIAAAPPWFHPDMTAILAQIQITLAQTRNLQLHDGNLTPFTIIPFNDGSMPPQYLPRLDNVAAVRALTPADSATYAAGYALGNIGTARARRVAIGRAIGCTVAI